MLDQALAEQRVDLSWNCRVNSVRATASYAWFEATRRSGAQDQSEAGSAALVALADGGAGEGYWQHDYHQCAVVAEISVADAKHLAIERFTPLGPIALLPQGERHALVWTLPEVLAQEVMALDDQAFQARLRGQFGVNAERLAHPGPRRAFPLHLRLARQPVERRLLRLGNAAQTLHPVAGKATTWACVMPLRLVACFARAGLQNWAVSASFVLSRIDAVPTAGARPWPPTA